MSREILDKARQMRDDINNHAPQTERIVNLPDARRMNLDEYMEALYNMSPEDIQSLSTRQWVTMFAVIDKLRKGKDIYDKVMSNLIEQGKTLSRRENLAKDEKIKASIKNERNKLFNRIIFIY